MGVSDNGNISLFTGMSSVAPLFMICMSYRSWFIHSLAESMYLGSDFRNNFSVSPGQDVKWLFLMACIKVDFTGLKAEACKNCAKSILVLSHRIITFIEWCYIIGGSALRCTDLSPTWMSQSLSLYLFCTVESICSFLPRNTLLSNKTLQLSSQKLPTWYQWRTV